MPFDEVCFLCGVAPGSPSEFTDEAHETAEDMADRLLEQFPNILSTLPTLKTKEELVAYLEATIEKSSCEDFSEIAGKGFPDCIAIGYFDDKGETPREQVDDPIVKLRFPDGQCVQRRWVGEPHYGSFRTVYWKGDTDTGRGAGDGYAADEDSMTGAIYQGGFGNFWLCHYCFELLRCGIEWAALPPMWEGRQLSFIGELWEIVNSRKTGREEHGGWFKWLPPGGPEDKIEETQDFLTTSMTEVYLTKTAVALQSGCDQDKTLRAIYDDYGFWMFVPAFKWPTAPKREDLIEVTALGFDLPPRATQTSLSTGSFPRLATEILDQIFRHLPNVQTYLNLKLVSKRMNDLVSDTKFALPILRKIIQPDPTREMFWIYPLRYQPVEIKNFQSCIYSWWCSSVGKNSVMPWDAPFHRQFPLIQFIHSLYTSDCSRNRRRLWKNMKRFEEVWIDYRRNGWEVNRFGLPYPELGQG